MKLLMVGRRGKPVGGRKETTSINLAADVYREGRKRAGEMKLKFKIYNSR